MTTTSRHASEDAHEQFARDASHVGDPVVMSTMWGSSPGWRSHVDFYVPETPEAIGTPRDLLRLLRLAPGKRGLILLGSVSRRHRYRDFVLALLVKMTRRPSRRPRILLTDATWEPESRSLSRLTGVPSRWFALPQKLMIRAIDGPHVHYAVLSRQERETFPDLWSVDPERVVFTPFPATIDPATPTTTGDYLFAGGTSYRDYDLLEEAVRPLDVPCRIAADWQPRRPHPRITAGLVPHEEFVRLLAGCRVAVVPLQDRHRSAGQQSYLNAMLLRKPVVVTDAPGVRDYIEDGVTGVVVPPEPEALRAAIRDVLDPARAAHYDEMGRRARAWVLTHATSDIYKDDVLLDAIGLRRDPDRS
ncbi:glycosyltransferase [Mobilicoccus pelagius]|uniref:Putative glycosyltransferase n=1 Tax=Mobilicoccus pelagius NBRC 104925 TaxID=1089455 RepID=H5UMQ6_9MICO|nr:glycosyltransferase [Mobilicoccus pelagius]GAB47014.1 putative glycosyltransferase [Mobilicoccus pelagius NBRC 104925]